MQRATCPLCEATCGLTVEVDGQRVTGVRGDPDDPFSRGYICPKAAALVDLHDDPDRLRRPLRRRGSEWEELEWDEALDEAGARLGAVQRAHGRDAVAVYAGNPTVHSHSAVLGGLFLMGALRTRNRMSANSVDALPRLLASYLIYGNQALIPIPDLDRTDLLLILGANPAVSNGSLMTAPDCRRRLKAIQARGGRVVVVDPRRSETAALADEHRFIRPGSDALLLLALLHVVFDERLDRPGKVARFARGLEQVRALARRVPPEAVAAATGIEPAWIRGLARAFAAAPSAVCYGRLGTTAQEHGALASWLIDVLNAVTGNLDRPGGAMFPTPAVDLARLATLTGQRGGLGRWRTRVRGLPEFAGEVPAVTLAEEIEVAGRGRIRGLVTHAGNPVLSLPNGRRLERALGGLEVMVSIDIYLNETTRHADLILPPTAGLEREHFPILFQALSVRNQSKLTPAAIAAAPGSRSDWEVLCALSARVLRARRPLVGRAAGAALEAFTARWGPRELVALGLRFGPHGRGLGRPRPEHVTVERLLANPQRLDLGPLEPRLPGCLPRRRVDLAPALFVREAERLAASLEAQRAVDAPAPDARAGSPPLPLRLIGRRHLRSNNSWMHNSRRLVKGDERCTLLLHPDDAAPRGLASGDRARLRSRVGELDVPVVVSDEVMPGVVSLPHGWGHHRPGPGLSVASERPGVSVNDLTDELLTDPISGCGVLNGVPVEVSRAADRGLAG